MATMSWIFRREKRQYTDAGKAAELLAHLDAAYTLARYLTDDEYAADDAVEEAFLGALSCGFRADAADDVQVSLLTFVRNTCVERTEHRESGPRRRAAKILDSGRMAERSASSLDHALYSLAPEFREVLLLRERCALSYSQISKIVNAPVGIVMSRLSRARIWLSQQLLSRNETEIRPRCAAE